MWKTRDQDNYFRLAHCESWLQVLPTCRHGLPQVTCRLLYKSVLFLVFGLILWKWMNGVDFLVSNQECRIGYKHSHSRVSQCLASFRKLGNCRSSEGLRSFKPSKGTNLFILIILAGDIEMNPSPRFQCGLCKKYCKASDRLLECEECEKRFHASCSKLGDNELLRIESDDGAWYCTNCKADCGLCSGAVLKGHKAVRCDSCVCGSIMNAHSLQKLIMKLWTIKLYMDLPEMWIVYLFTF